MRLAGITLIPLTFGCKAHFPTTVEAENAQLETLAPVGSSFSVVSDKLLNSGKLDWATPASSCKDFHVWPTFRCSGGPALRVMLNPDTRPKLRQGVDLIVMLPIREGEDYGEEGLEPGL